MTKIEEIRKRVRPDGSVLTEDEYQVIRGAQVALLEGGGEAGRLVAAALSFLMASSFSVRSLESVVDDLQVEARRQLASYAKLKEMH